VLLVQYEYAQEESETKREKNAHRKDKKRKETKRKKDAHKTKKKRKDKTKDT